MMKAPAQRSPRRLTAGGAGTGGVEGVGMSSKGVKIASETLTRKDPRLLSYTRFSQGERVYANGAL